MHLVLTSLKSQLRLNSFFIQPSNLARGSTGSPKPESHSPLSSRRSSTASTDGTEILAKADSTLATSQKCSLPDYGRFFLPFFEQPHTVVAWKSRFSRDDKEIEYAQESIDKCINPSNATSREENDTSDLDSLLHISINHSKRRRRPRNVVKDIITRVNRNIQHPTDHIDSKANRTADRAKMLNSIPTKYLRFAEDVRPPYIGTYTKFPSDDKIRKLCKRPFNRILPQTNYDYDSEAEWEEPGEGEDLHSEGEEETNEEEDDDDMEGFLDDEEGADGTRIMHQKRRPMIGNLEPTSTGICWQNDCEATSKAAKFESRSGDLQSYGLEVILGKAHGHSFVYDLT